MSSRTPFVLNSLLLLPIIGLLTHFTGWSTVMGLILSALLVLVANGFMFVKALWNREYKLAIIYFVIAFGAILLFACIHPSGKIGK